MKFVVPIWYFFAIGPACIWGNSAFSFAGFPPLWSWQIFWWPVGIVMMWALTFKAGLATTDDEQLARAEKEFWGRHLWARGYFASSSVNVTDEVILQYVQLQDVRECVHDDDFTLAQV